MSRLIDADDLFRRLGEVTPTHAELEAVRQTVFKWPECDNSELVQEVRRRGIVVDATIGGRMIDSQELLKWVTEKKHWSTTGAHSAFINLLWTKIMLMTKQMAGEKEVTPEPDDEMQPIEADGNWHPVKYLEPDHYINKRFKELEKRIAGLESDRDIEHFAKDKLESCLSKMEEALDQHLVEFHDFVARWPIGWYEVDGKANYVIDRGFVDALKKGMFDVSSPVEVTGALSASGLGASGDPSGSSPVPSETDTSLRSVGSDPSRVPPTISYNPAAKVFFKGFEDSPRQGDTRWTLEVFDGILWQEYKIAPIPDVKP